MEHASGTVKWFSQEKGFGFVTRDDGTDVFVHHSGITGRGFKTLEQGEPVEFDILEEPKGLKAQNLVRLNAPEGDGLGGGAGDDDDNIGNRIDNRPRVGGYGEPPRGGRSSARDDRWGNRGAGGGYGDGAW
jgi:CspA family cold shock protein